MEKRERKIGAHIFFACANVLGLFLLFLTVGDYKELFNGIKSNTDIVKFSTYSCFIGMAALVPLVHGYLIMHQLRPDYWIKRAHAVNKFCIVALIVTFSSGFVVAPLMSKAVTDRNYIRCPKLDNVGTTYKYYTRNEIVCSEQTALNTAR